jgi:hypothetical protein
MPPRGRPHLTEDVVRERIEAYCSRYGVKDFNDAGFPAYPAGKRESRQHHDWVNLFKAWSRLRRRTNLQEGSNRAAGLRAQSGQCPICLKKLKLSDATEAPASARRETPLVHSACKELLRLVGTLGPSVIDRLSSYFWPASPAPSEGRTHIRTR